MKFATVSSVMYLRRLEMKNIDKSIATVPVIPYHAPPMPRVYPYWAEPMVEVPPIWKVTRSRPTVAHVRFLPPFAHWDALLTLLPANMPTRQIITIRPNIITAFISPPKYQVVCFD